MMQMIGYNTTYEEPSNHSRRRRLSDLIASILVRDWSRQAPIPQLCRRFVAETVEKITSIRSCFKNRGVFRAFKKNITVRKKKNIKKALTSEYIIPAEDGVPIQISIVSSDNLQDTQRVTLCEC